VEGTGKYRKDGYKQGRKKKNGAEEGKQGARTRRRERTH
jgi:hypothetical protein